MRAGHHRYAAAVFFGPHDRAPSWLVSVALILGAGACSPTACNDEDRQIGREVEVLIGEPGPALKSAKQRLRERGVEAIVILETGLYQADELGRMRIIDVLRDIAHPEVVPVLRHLAEHDDAEDVREHAKSALAKLERQGLSTAD